jgi:hypothetical protein
LVADWRDSASGFVACTTVGAAKAGFTFFSLAAVV